MPSRRTRCRPACKDLQVTPCRQGRPPLLTERWPCPTGLASYLSSCFSFTDGRGCFQLALTGRRRDRTVLRRTHRTSPGLKCPSSRSVCEAEPCGRISLSEDLPGSLDAHPSPLAHSSNCRSFSITVSVSPAKTQPNRPDSTRSRFLSTSLEVMPIAPLVA